MLEIAVIHAICCWCLGSATCAGLDVIVNSARYVRGEPTIGQPAFAMSG